MGLKGLPADYLALDEDNIYWSNSITPTVYYVTRTDRTTVLLFSVPDNMGVLLSTSPGTQPFPNSGGKYLCLSDGIMTKGCCIINLHCRYTLCGDVRGGHSIRE